MLKRLPDHEAIFSHRGEKHHGGTENKILWNSRVPAYRLWIARFNDLPVRNQLYGSSLAAGHFTHAVNSDNTLELAVGIPGADGASGKHKVGAVILYPKQANGTETQAHQTLTPGPNGDNIDIPEETGLMFGFALATGDFDGNGVDDLAIGCPGFGDSLGFVAVRYGGSPLPAAGLLEGPGSFRRR